MPEFAGVAKPLADGDIAALAMKIEIEPAAIWAVCDVESAGSGFLPDGRPKILYEAHIFGKLTDHRWDAAYPNISASYWNRSLYGASGAHQYDRLAVAITLDRKAALQSASWGRFQVLGTNFHTCGFADIESFVAAMCESEAAQLAAFSEYCRVNNLTRHLRSHNWAAFALGYNGEGHAANGYDTKLADAYERRSRQMRAAGTPQAATATKAVLRKGDRGEAVSVLQRALSAAGHPTQDDGDFGPATERAVVSYQESTGLGADGVAGPLTLAALGVG